MRYENRPEKDTPEAVRMLLCRYGGLNPDGRPLWRMVLAANRRMRAAGVMQTIAEGSDSARPVIDRIEEGVFWVPRYRFEGWVLERWMPASCWGTEGDWRAHRDGADGMTQMLAAWPRWGDYVFRAGPWPVIEAAGDLRRWIAEDLRQMRERPVDWEAYLRAEIAEEQRERADAASAYEEMVSSGMRSEVMPAMGSLSLDAQRARNQLAVAVGGEDWQMGAW